MPETPLRQFRLDDTLVRRLDRYAKHLSKENPCFLVNRTSTLRHILIKHLEQWENETNVRPKSTRKSKR
jgi:predicted transcriptional regulator